VDEVPLTYKALFLSSFQRLWYTFPCSKKEGGSCISGC